MFVFACLLLCLLILRHQIAAHPLPPILAQRPGSGPDLPDSLNWQAASPAGTRAVQTVVTRQLTALRDNRAAALAACQSRRLNQRFGSAEMLLQMVRGRHPELTGWRHLTCGPVSIDSTGQYARTLVLLDGGSGSRTRGMLLLVREEGRFKVDWIRTQILPN